MEQLGWMLLGMIATLGSISFVVGMKDYKEGDEE